MSAIAGWSPLAPGLLAVVPVLVFVDVGCFFGGGAAEVGAADESVRGVLLFQF